VTDPVMPREAAFAFASHGDWARAVPALRAALAHDPEDASAQALLALGLAHLEQPREAVEAGRRAVTLAPELSLAHYALGRALLDHDDIAAAERAAREALRLDPDADGYALLAQVFARQQRWKDVLDAVAQGLQIDAEHTGLANLRGLALASLGRASEAANTIGKALATDPDNPASHVNRGWLLLRQGEHDQALEAFRTALRLDPTLQAARAGIVESLKARSGLYRPILRAAFWMSRFDARTRWWIVVGLFIANRVVRGLLGANPEWRPVLMPLLVLYAVFAISTWLVGPISNLLLRLNPYGRLVLSKEDTLAANIVGACLATAAIAGLMTLVAGTRGWGTLALVSLLVLIPVSGAFQGYGTRRWRPLLITILVLAGLGALAVVLSFLGSKAASVPLAILVVGAILFSWLASYLSVKFL
jgi:Tfp pilus assembly protein PilF